MRNFVYFFNLLFIVTSVTADTSSSVLDNLHYVGCYDIGFALSQHYGHIISPSTLAQCVQYCKTLKLKFAGLDDDSCYCGPDIGEASIKRNDSLCNVECPDAALRTCGGDWLLSLYEIMGSSHTNKTDDVDFLIGLSNGVRLYHSDEIQYDTLATTKDWVYSVDFHLSKKLLFFRTKSQMFRMNLQPQETFWNINATLMKNVSSCEGLSVDWVNDRVFWSHCLQNGTVIKAADLNGEKEKIVLISSDIGPQVIKRMVIDPYKGILFWAANGVIQSCDLSGGSFTPDLTRHEVSVRDLALDLRQRRVYYVGQMEQYSSLYSMDYTGGGKVTTLPPRHFTIEQLRSVYGLTVLGDRVFWVNYANVRDIIYESSINLTQTSDLRVIQSIDRAVWHMKVLHPLLQTRPKNHPCLDKNCSFSCDITRSMKKTFAHCECPDGYVLNDDDVSCSEMKWKSSSRTGIATHLGIGILLVLGVLGTAMGLVYLTNKYWALLESKFFGVPYSRNHGKEEQDVVGTSEYHAGEDNVNLV